MRGQELIVWPMDIMSHIWFVLGCGEKKEATEVWDTDLEPPARTEKYITSIMDEGSFDNMNEAGIPMLVSEYNITV